MKSQRTKHALWLYMDVLLAPACIILPNTSANVALATSKSDGRSEMKSLRSIISRFSAIGLEELFEGMGRAAALASAPASTSSKVIGKGSAAGFR